MVRETKFQPPYGLRTRTNYCLQNTFGFDYTAADVAKRSRDELLQIRNFGEVCLAEVEAWLAREGYACRSEEPSN